MKPDEDIEEVSKFRRARLLAQAPFRRRDITPHYEDYYAEKGLIITIRDTEGKIAGLGISQEQTETVSFAYQINMDVLNGRDTAGKGMFRN